MADFVRYDEGTGYVISHLLSMNTSLYTGQPGFLEVSPTWRGQNDLIVDEGVVRVMVQAEIDNKNTLRQAASLLSSKEAAKQEGAALLVKGLLKLLLPVVNDFRTRNSQSTVTLSQIITALKSEIDSE